MNAQPLYLADGRAAEVAYCGECKVVWRSVEDTEKCCTPSSCRTCASECKHGRLQCDACMAALLAQREQERFDKAEKVALADYDGDYVYVEDADLYLNLDALGDWIKESKFEHVQAGGSVQNWTPPYVYATSKVQHTANAEDVVEAALNDAHDDAYSEVDSDAIAELDVYLRAWCLAHLPGSFEQDTTRAIILEPTTPSGSSC